MNIKKCKREFNYLRATLKTLLPTVLGIVSKTKSASKLWPWYDLDDETYEIVDFHERLGIFQGHRFEAGEFDFSFDDWHRWKFSHKPNGSRITFSRWRKGHGFHFGSFGFSREIRTELCLVENRCLFVGKWSLTF